MSLRGQKFDTKYNRAQETEENRWPDILWQEETRWYFEDDSWDWAEERDWAWFYMGAPFGYCNDVAEYQQMRLLTLLRKLAISTARQQAESRGW